jgi:CRP/FNR family cyclic AMP-dependent transcriptional regulator
MYDKEKLLSVLKSVTIFSGIDDANLEKIYSQCEVVAGKADDVIIEEGTDATHIFIMLSGRVKVVLNYHDEPLEIVELGAGHCVGEASIIGIQKHCASAVIMEDSEILVFPRHVLIDIYENDKALFSMLILNIARELARRLYKTDQALLRYKSKK